MYLLAQKIFFDDPTVLYVSLHAQDGYPCMFPDFTGSPEETGEGAGRGYNINFPLPKGTGDGEYCTALRLATSRITDYNATYIVIR